MYGKASGNSLHGQQISWQGIRNHQGGTDSVSHIGRSPIWSLPVCQLGDSVGGRLRKGTMLLPAFLSWRKLSPSSCPDARQCSSSLYVSGSFQSADPVLELRVSEFEHRPFKRNFQRFQQFLSAKASILTCGRLQPADSACCG